MNIRNLALTAALSLALIGCGERTMSAGGSSGKPKTPPYAMRGADQSWPGAPGNDIQLANNLQAKNYYFVFDGSGSMEDQACGDGRQRIDTAKAGPILSTSPQTKNRSPVIAIKPTKVPSHPK